MQNFAEACSCFVSIFTRRRHTKGVRLAANTKERRVELRTTSAHSTYVVGTPGGSRYNNKNH